jgi:hypothetical protein
MKWLRGKSPEARYSQHWARVAPCKNYLDRLGNPITMKLSFEEWFKIWQDSGHWEERGKYVMSRINDLGSYEIGNVFIQTKAANSIESIIRQPRRAGWNRGIKTPTEVRLKISNARRKQCTIDGKTIYPSQGDLVREFGWGKSGAKHPAFRYIQNQTAVEAQK